MDKATIIKALECCCSDTVNCEECYYYGIDACDQRMCSDAIKLLKANSEAPKTTEPTKAKYQQVYIFTKRTNMLPFMTGKTTQHISSREAYTRCREFYAREREVQLICMFRWERTTKGTKIFCKIKCPINPLPVKGEFEIPSISAIEQFLANNDWYFKQKLYPSMFE